MCQTLDNLKLKKIVLLMGLKKKILNLKSGK
jgi:hypothetical protein